MHTDTDQWKNFVNNYKEQIRNIKCTHVWISTLCKFPLYFHIDILTVVSLNNSNFDIFKYCNKQK